MRRGELNTSLHLRFECVCAEFLVQFNSTHSSDADDEKMQCEFEIKGN